MSSEKPKTRVLTENFWNFLVKIFFPKIFFVIFSEKKIQENQSSEKKLL